MHSWPEELPDSSMVSLVGAGVWFLFRCWFPFVGFLDKKPLLPLYASFYPFALFPPAFTFYTAT